jgi:hypothetical protein
VFGNERFIMVHHGCPPHYNVTMFSRLQCYYVRDIPTFGSVCHIATSGYVCHITTWGNFHHIANISLCLTNCEITIHIITIWLLSSHCDVTMFNGMQRYYVCHCAMLLCTRHCNITMLVTLQCPVLFVILQWQGYVHDIRTYVYVHAIMELLCFPWQGYVHHSMTFVYVCHIATIRLC